MKDGNKPKTEDIAAVTPLSPELHRRAKATAAMKGQTLQEFIREAVETAVNAAGHVE
jgi:predicted HicB family RNase H-like nuclease